MYLLIAEGKI